MRLLVFTIMFAGFVFAGQFKIMTEDLPPYNYLKDGKLTGISVDVVTKMLDNLGYKDEKIELYPWSRALLLLENQNNSMLFSTTYTIERAQKYKFACPITPVISYFYKNKNSSIKINSLEDAKKVGSIGVVKDFVQHQELMRLEFDNLDISSKQETIIEKLIAGRVDLIPANPIEIYSDAYSHLSIDKLENTGVSYAKSAVCIAFNKSFSDEEVAKWESELKKLHESGEYKKIYNKYVKEVK